VLPPCKGDRGLTDAQAHRAMGCIPSGGDGRVAAKPWRRRKHRPPKLRRIHFGQLARNREKLLRNPRSQLRLSVAGKQEYMVCLHRCQTILPKIECRDPAFALEVLIDLPR
jgi:hypothetical protein